MSSAGFHSLPCSLPGVFAVEAHSRHRFPRHTHGHFGVGVIVAGAQRSASGRGLVQAEAGDLITVNPGEVHDGVPLDERGRSWRMLYFEPAVVRAQCAGLGDDGMVDEFTMPVLRDPAAASSFLHLFQAMAAPMDSTGGLRRDAALATLFMRLFGSGVETAAHGGVPAGVARARARIDDDPVAPASLQQLAELAGLSRFQLLRGFAKATGMTPHAYLLQRRVDLARGLIERGDPLAQAALAAGFADQSHMTRVFVRAYGVSPWAYARVVGR
ncbi:AraC-like DNA-binding protein [Cupriavidus gilardii J11]|uniref:AraC-like DNA-binding protein n=1 Tax=Cupriavidus gilardii J11 TaxID=936133 RepID=A0A562BL45_9BURK|nr:AraC family transcriptional regulator [Cupriavidus gilardii]TWG85995.1 AraC-like DNA-binding protein [Cupriavidus gilardii J11]